MIDYCLTENRFVLSNRLNISNIIIGEYLKKIWKIVFESFQDFFLLFFYESDRACKSEESSVLLIVIGNFRTEVRLLIFEGKLLFTSDPRDAINVSSSYGRIFREIGSRDTQFRLRSLG